MSEAPERIWAGSYRYSDENIPDWTPYIRADLAGLPEDLVERLRMVAEGDANGAYSYRPATPLEKEILAWHEQRTGEKE